MPVNLHEGLPVLDLVILEHPPLGKAPHQAVADNIASPQLGPVEEELVFGEFLAVEDIIVSNKPGMLQEIPFFVLEGESVLQARHRCFPRKYTCRQLPT